MNGILSLGCVYLECVSWYFGGRNEVNSFVVRRSIPDEEDPNFKFPAFFILDKDSGTKSPVSAHVNPEVIQVSWYFRVLILLDQRCPVSRRPCHAYFLHIYFPFTDRVIIEQYMHDIWGRSACMDAFLALIRDHMLVANKQSDRMAAANIARALGNVLVHSGHYWAAGRGSGDFR